VSQIIFDSVKRVFTRRNEEFLALDNVSFQVCEK